MQGTTITEETAAPACARLHPRGTVVNDTLAHEIDEEPRRGDRGVRGGQALACRDTTRAGKFK